MLRRELTDRERLELFQRARCWALNGACFGSSALLLTQYVEALLNGVPAPVSRYACECFACAPALTWSARFPGASAWLEAYGSGQTLTACDLVSVEARRHATMGGYF